jgi:hypothetical protein
MLVVIKLKDTDWKHNESILHPSLIRSLLLHKEIDQSRWALHAASFQSKTQSVKYNKDNKNLLLHQEWADYYLYSHISFFYPPNYIFCGFAKVNNAFEVKKSGQRKKNWSTCLTTKRNNFLKSYYYYYYYWRFCKAMRWE